MAQGIGYKDSDGSYGFRLTEDGKVILGNSSDDLIQVTGTLSVSGTLYAGTESPEQYHQVIGRFLVDAAGTNNSELIIDGPNPNFIMLQRAGTLTGKMATDGYRFTMYGGSNMVSQAYADSGVGKIDFCNSNTQVTSGTKHKVNITASADALRIDTDSGTNVFRVSGDTSYATKLSLGGTTITATGTELNYVDGVTSAIQTQLDAKAPSTGIAAAALASDCIIPAKIDTSVAGNGITGGGGSALAVGAGTGVTVNANDVAIGQAVGTGDTVEFSKVKLNTSTIGGNEVVRVLGTGDNFNTLVVFGADTTTEYVSLGVNSSGNPTIAGGYSNSTQPSNLCFATQEGGGAAEAVKMTLTNDGKLGINKTDPTVALAIGGDLDLSDSSTIKRVTLEAGTGADAFFGFGEDSNERGWIGWDAGDQKITLGSVSDNGTFNDTLVVNDAKVGIGTSTPYANLSIAGDHDGGIVSLRLGADNDAGSNYTSRLEFSEDTNGSQVMQWGAFLEFDGDAASPDLGMFTIGVRDDSTTDTNVIRISRKAEANSLVLGDTDVTIAAPSGSVNISGSNSDVNLQVKSDGITLNAQGEDIELKGNVHIPPTDTFHVEGTAGFSNNLGVGLATPSYGQLEVYKNSSTSAANITIHQDHSSGDSRLHLRSDVNDWYIINDGGNDDLVFINESTERMRLANDTQGLTVQSITCNGAFAQDSGAATFDHSLSVAGPFTVSNSTSPVGHLTHTNTTDGTTKTILKLQHNQEDSTADFDSGERFIEFYDSNSMLGYIHSEVSYSTFTGAHVSQQKAGQDYSGWKKGMILSSTGEVISSGDISRNWIQVGLSQQQKDPKVAGVFTDFMTEHELKDFDPTVPAINYNALGEGKILVTNINGNIENGDYITTCEIPGYGMKQEDDLLHNYTVAKITQDCLFDLNSTTYECEEIQHNGQTYRVAFVGCTYHCG